MDVTLLGTGDATAVPAPLCDCAYCAASDRRRNPALLVETAGTTLLLDVGPDVREQLHETGVRDVDAAFLTHAHGDHAAGLPGLAQTAKWDADHLDAVDGLEPTGPSCRVPAVRPSRPTRARTADLRSRAASSSAPSSIRSGSRGGAAGPFCRAAANRRR